MRDAARQVEVEPGQRAVRHHREHDLVVVAGLECFSIASIASGRIETSPSTGARIASRTAGSASASLPLETLTTDLEAEQSAPNFAFVAPELVPRRLGGDVRRRLSGRPGGSRRLPG